MTPTPWVAQRNRDIGSRPYEVYSRMTSSRVGKLYIADPVATALREEDAKAIAALPELMLAAYQALLALRRKEDADSSAATRISTTLEAMLGTAWELQMMQWWHNQVKVVKDKPE